MITPTTVLVRKFRPLLVNIGLLVYLCYRLSNLSTSSPSLMKLFNDWCDSVREWISQVFLHHFFSSSSSSRTLAEFASTAIQICSIISQDIIVLTGILGLLRVVYCSYQFPKVWTWKDRFVNHACQCILNSRSSWSVVNQEIEKVANQFLKEANHMLRKDPNRTIRHALPKEGMEGRILLQELNSCARDETRRCDTGKISGTVYSKGKKHSELMSQVYSLYQWSNPLKPGVWPRVNQCEAEIISMTANVLNAPSSTGCVTSGGTESILTAVRAHLEVYGKRRGILYPEIICGSTAHVALYKACDVLNVRLVSIDCNDSTQSYQLRADRVQKHITSNTIMIFASAPSFPQGVIDPIQQLSKVAIRYDVGFHVDACLGGFVLPFLSDPDIPQQQMFDFRLPGVTSISADSHKYGCATKGTSILIFRSMDLQHASYFPYTSWSGGLYITPTLAGSRPGAIVACAWAALMSIGQTGYTMRANAIVKAARRVAKEISSIDGLKLMTPNPTMVVAFGSDKFNIYRIKDCLAKKGWILNPLQYPAGLNLCLTENFVASDGVVDEFLQSLRTAVDEVKAPELACKNKAGDTAGIYKAIQIIPTALSCFALCRFIDATLAP